jgi:hypothetical protein
VVVVVVGAAIVTVGAAVQVPEPPKVIPVTAHEATVAVAVTVVGQALLSVTVGTVVYPVPPLVMVALRRVVAGIVVPVTVAEAPVEQVTDCPVIVAVAAVPEVPVPESVMVYVPSVSAFVYPTFESLSVIGAKISPQRVYPVPGV